MAQNEQRSVLTQEHIEERRLGVHRTILTLVCVVVLGACNGPAGGGVTQVKYIYDRAASSVLLPDDTVITAPAGKHYGLFFINCVDNSSRTSGFWFVGDRLRDNNNQATQNNQVHDVISLPSEFVSGGDIIENVAKVVFLLDGPPGFGVVYHLFYASQAGDSVLMVNQNSFGPLVYLEGAAMDVEAIEGSPFFPEGSELCGTNTTLPPGHPEPPEN